MDSDQGKLFIGGISWETSEEKLKEYFGNYGEILQTVVMRDKISGRPRGFGFVVFSDPSVLDTVLQEKHTLDGRTVEAKRALSREEQQVSKAGNPNAGRSFGGGGGGGGGGGTRTKKIFVGGLPPTLSEEGFRQYFEAYGQVTDVVVMYDQQTNRPRGFGFISFDSEDAVDRVLHKTFHDLNGKQVEVKRALPKDANPGGSSGGSGRSMGGGGGGGYQGYGASGGNLGSYEGRMDSNRYMQQQSQSGGGGGGGGGGFPGYGSSGYGTAGYGYGQNGMGYNGYGGYGGGTPGYGGAPAAPYGNPTAARTSWNAQPSSGYGGGAGAYGAAAPWGGASGGSQAAPPTGQSPSGGAAYGTQYGYGGGYGGNDGGYGNPAGYGAVGGRIGGAPATNSAAGGGGDIQSSGSSGAGGYGGYGDANANGYGNNSGWRGDPSQAAGNYGVQGNGGGGGGGGYGGYGGGPVRQQ